jgi:two-component system, LuxR family, sensor kinase FixL
MILQQDSPDYHEIGAILADIRQDDQRAGAVIDRMRSLLSRRNLQFEKLSLRELIDQVLLLTRTEMRAREVTLEANVPDNLPSIRGDRIHLQQVILNLLVNGADAMTGFPAEQTAA